MRLNMSLKKKLIITNLSILLLFGAVLFFQFTNSLIQQKTEIRKAFQENSEKLSSNISQNFFFFYHNVQAIAKNAVLKEKDFASNNFLLNELVSLYPVYDYLLLTDLEGNYIASSSIDKDLKNLNIKDVRSLNFSDRSWFKETKTGKLTEDLNKKIFGARVGQFQKSDIGSVLYGKDIHGIHFTTQIQDDYGEPKAILTTFVSSRWLTDEISNINSSLEVQGMKGAKIHVFSNDKIFTSSDSSRQLTQIKESEVNNIKTKGAKGSIIGSFLRIDSPLIAYTKISSKKFLDNLNWETYVQMSSDAAFSGVYSSKNLFTISFFVSLLLAATLAYFISRNLSNDMSVISEKVKDGSVNVANTGNEISEQANKLSSSTQEQASSLQETASSLNEIQAMVEQNTNNTQSSKDLSNKSRISANGGVEKIDEMLEAIDEISLTNTEIIDQMNQNFQEMTEITKVISDISDKTKMINDIVFQTKLLSFNASVEAARAGEHGKGFAVVAEEVGALAKTSGDASQEIEELLHKSVSRVDEMVKVTKAKAEALAVKGGKKIDLGKDVASACKLALTEILDFSVNLDQSIEEIANASIEQNQGLQEISNSMAQLDSVTQQNNSVALMVSDSLKELNLQSETLQSTSENLSVLIYGNKEKVTFEKNNSLPKPTEETKPNNLLVLDKKNKQPAISSEPLVEKKELSSQVINSDQWDDI